MTVVRVFFPGTNARDIHLLPGLVSPRLDQLLHIQTRTGGVDAEASADHPPAGVTTQFFAQFIGTPEAHGVKVDERTGEVVVASPLPAGPRLRSFIVLCGCTEGTNHFVLPVRVHVHEDVRDMWVAPSPLHVREGAAGVRLSVLARFDDGVVGDITNWSALNPPSGADDRRFVHRAGEPVPALTWSSPHVGGVRVDQNSGVLTAESPAARETVTVALRPLPAPPNQTASSLVLGAPAWSTPVTVSHVQGRGFAGMAGSRNILFLPDGFTDDPAERSKFGALVRGIVRRLTYHPQTSPFDLLSQQQSFNYFMAWVPSPERGVSVLDEQDRFDVVGDLGQGRPIELPVPARSGVAAWTLPELLYEVGEPTPTFDTPGSPLGAEDDPASRLHAWRELYGEDVTSGQVTGPHTEPDGTGTTVYEAWLDRSDRVLLNDKDTAFHLALGDRPRIDGSTTERDLLLNALRLTDADFNTFLTALVDDQGHAIGGVWASGGPDEDLVVMLSHNPRNGGTNSGRSPSGHLLALSLDTLSDVTLVADPDGPGFLVVDDPVPDDVPVDTWVTVAHELAHSWLLLDEYGGTGPIDDASADELKDVANAQPLKTLRTANHLDGDLIKWRWPRIAKAGVLAAPPTDDGGGGAGPFRGALQAHHGYEFAVGDLVRLRTRPLPTAVTSDRLRISRMLGDGDQVELVLLPGSALDVTKFPAGSLLICPLRADQPDGTPGDDLELVHASVRARISATHNPLNAADGEPFDRPCTGAELPTPTGATNFPGGSAPKPPRYSSWIVGLHESGATFDCGVYRPTGVCLMREETFTDGTGHDRAYEFCPVCRYTIVDVVDPFWHRDVDVGMRDRFLP